MPVILRVETDLFRFSNVCRHMVCPMTTDYHVAGGLIDAFIKVDPTIKDKYKDLCESQSFAIGKPHCERTNATFLWDTIFFPMKAYVGDTAKYKDVRRNIEGLRTMLSLPKHKHSVVGMPMLGCEGGGEDPYKRVLDMVYLYLDPLPATTFLSMSPSKAPVTPEYLVIAGPKGLATTPEGKARLEKGIQAALQKWGKTLSDFTAVVTGSETSCDKYLAGTPEAPNGWLTTQGVKKVIPLAINWEEDQSLALTRHRMVLAEIGTHFIFVMPEDLNNNRAIYLNAYVKEANEKLRSLNRPEKAVIVLGRSTQTLVDESPLNIE